MNNFKIIKGREAKSNFLPGILELDKLVYPIKYHTNLEYMSEWYKKNKDILTFLFDNDELIGYICCLPIHESTYKEIRKGEVFQDLTIPVENVLQYFKGDKYNIYIFSIVIKPKYHGTEAVKYLLKGFLETILQLEKEGVIFNKILADTVSFKGTKLALSFGFDKIKDSNYSTAIYENTYKNMKRYINF